MAYPYVCDACLNQLHERCEVQKGEGFGVGFCVCNGCEHDVSNDKFAQSVWDRDMRTKDIHVTSA